MRHRRNDRDQAQRRMDARCRERPPAQDSGNQQVPPEACDTDSAKSETNPDRRNREQQPFGIHRFLWIKHGEDDQSRSVIGNCQQKQKNNGRMPAAEDQPRHEIAESDVRRAGNRPASTERFSFTQQTYPGQVDQRRSNDTTSRCDQRRCRRPQIRQRPARQQSLPDFLGGNCKEQCHSHIVDEKMEIDVLLFKHRQFMMHEVVIAGLVEICPDDRRERSSEQKDRVLQQKRQRSLDRPGTERRIRLRRHSVPLLFSWRREL